MLAAPILRSLPVPIPGLRSIPHSSMRLFTSVCGACVLSIASPSTGAAQQRVPAIGLTLRASTATPLVNDLRARTTIVTYTPITLPRDSVTPHRTHRARHALIGGALGSIVGVAACYYVVGFGSDTGDTAACRPLGRVMFALGGFGVGALIGALIP